MTFDPSVIQTLIGRIKWDAQGLVPVIAQEAGGGKVLMHAWMNREALAETLQQGEMVYWSRSKGRLWRKGESSGHVQRLVELHLDCDGDTLLAMVEQKGVACHTGRSTCFFHRVDEKGLTITSAPEVSPEAMYGKDA